MKTVQRKEGTAKEKHLYFGYVIIGILYIAIKLVYVLAGYLHIGAIAHGAIPAVLTAAVGIYAMSRNKGNQLNSVWHWVLMVLPVLIFFITPLFMYLKQGEMWLANGRFSVLIIYECLAIMQFLAASLIKWKNI
jgi:hypothetical protein